MITGPLAGYIGAGIAVFCFGTYAVPTKIVPTGDGMFFQWIECSTILLVGMIIQFSVGFYVFQPLAVLGGVLWTLGNITVVPIVQAIGLSLGMLIWGITNMLVGWSCGHFGLFVAPEKVKIPFLNYIGVGLAIMSILLYLPIKTTIKEVRESKEEDDDVEVLLVNHEEKETPKRNDASKKIMGFVAALMAGVFYGFNMVPVSYLENKSGMNDPLHYAFSHFCGIWLCSTFLMLAYAGIKKNNPWYHPKLVLPASAAGLLWAIAQSGWFIANSNLGLSVSFPIVCTGPGVVASLFSILVFKEIQGKRNFIFLISAFLMTFTGILCITFSR